MRSAAPLLEMFIDTTTFLLAKAMHAAMFRLGRKYFEIDRIVVEDVSIFVMDDFSRTKRPSNHGFCNGSMLVLAVKFAVCFSFASARELRMVFFSG